MTPTLRFAPSPNGFLHIGHGYSALLNAKIARELGADCLLRIEDIDQTRCRPHFTTAIIEDLAALGLNFKAPRIQSEHFSFYAKALNELENQGLLIQDFSTRTGGVDDKFSLKLDMQKALSRISQPLIWQDFMTGEIFDAMPMLIEDVVLKRKDTPTSYHLSVVLDDALQGITHVVRGKDLHESTPIHLVLQKLLGLKTPLYHHHSLIIDNEGEKLAKSKFSLPMREQPLEAVILAIEQAIAQL
jgi:glutamyl-Q tRNA(Asp) synthetase